MDKIASIFISTVLRALIGDRLLLDRHDADILITLLPKKGSFPKGNSHGNTKTQLYTTRPRQATPQPRNTRPISTSRRLRPRKRQRQRNYESNPERSDRPRRTLSHPGSWTDRPGGSLDRLDG